MNWKRLFKPHILDRGYNYYCDNAVVNMQISEEAIKADVIGTDDYEVEIILDNNEIVDMYCSCPYADGQKNCKHMAAVLYEWNKGENEEDFEEDGFMPDYMFINANLVKEQKLKREAIQALIDKADIDMVKTYLNDILLNDEKLLVRFRSMVKGNDKLSINMYKRQVDDITNKYLGRDRFIGYYEAMDFIYELMEIYDVDIRRMIDARQYMEAFELMNYIFALVGDVDMDDSDGGTGILADKTYDLWLELLQRVTDEEKRDMFKWFTTHLDGTIIDYLEDYIERIIMEEFQEEEYISLKKKFIEDMLDNVDDSIPEWSANYYIGKWALRYISLLEKEGNNKEHIEDFCANFWGNSDIRRYCINKSVKEKNMIKP